MMHCIMVADVLDCNADAWHMGVIVPCASDRANDHLDIGQGQGESSAVHQAPRASPWRG
jgi:hypothetical protein